MAGGVGYPIGAQWVPSNPVPYINLPCPPEASRHRIPTNGTARKIPENSWRHLRPKTDAGRVPLNASWLPAARCDPEGVKSRPTAAPVNALVSD